MPRVTISPVPTLTVTVGGTITLTCTAVGVPTPLISWRLNWGNIPTGARVTETSVDGRGTLIIRNVVKTDAGAYTCEAINNQNSIFGNPDAIVTVTMGGTPQYDCPRGTFNDVAIGYNECLNCFCSGVSNDCRSSNMVIYRTTIDEGVTLADERGSAVPSYLYTYDRTYRQYKIDNYANAPPGFLYWKLPGVVRGKQLAAYGGTLRYTIEYEAPTGQLTSAYDVIVVGSNLVAYCSASSASFIPDRVAYVQMQLRERDCVTVTSRSSNDVGVPEPISREDFMRILTDVQDILVRATYSPNQYTTLIREISIESSAALGSSGSRAVLVEECVCPQGYTGMSCEECDTGYRRQGGACVPVQPSRCDPQGTEREEFGRCICKPFVTGTYCDQCLDNTFHLNPLTTGGCIECFCMGVTTDCASTSRLREVARVSYVNTDGWTLAGTDGVKLLGLENVISATGSEMVADLRRLGSGSYYWKLPDVFNGNKLGAYGGKLRFNIKFIAPSVVSTSSDPDIIIFGGEGLQLTSPFTNIALDDREYNAELVMLEDYWHRSDDASFSREHMLMALSDVQSILIKASITRDTSESRISQVSLDVASERAPVGSPRAYEVEECNCPAGYQGLSCETCLPGYSRAAGVYLGICTQCDCNGHSDDCDSNTGYCINCLHGTTGRQCERCAPGYDRNSQDNSQYECVNPSTLVSIAEPTITVTIGGNAELVCSPYASGLPYANIGWRRADGRALPRTAVESQPGRLVIQNVQSSYAGEYICTITTTGGIVGTGISTIVIITRPVVLCPRGYANPPSCDVCDTGYVFNSARQCVPQESLIVSVNPSSLSVNTGDEIRLYCAARSQVDSSAYVVAWRRENGGLSASAVETNGQLYISQATLSDNGVYICTGSNRYEQKEARVVVTVRNDVRPPTQLAVSIAPAKLYVPEGGTGTLRCRITGNARSVSWRRSRDVDIAAKNLISTTTVRGDTLTFVNMDGSDRGYYYCTAVGTDIVTSVEASSPALVDFQRSFVSVLTPEVRVVQGATARLECRATSTVTVTTIVWTRDDGRFMDSRYSQSNGILVITNTEPIDSGSFTCTVRTLEYNSPQSVTAGLTVDRRVIVEPMEVSIVGVNTDSLSYRTGSTINLLCEFVSGRENARIYWQFSDGRMPANVQTIDGRLYIASANEDNTGTYTCVGSDGRSNIARDSIYVVVSRPTQVINLPDKFDAPLYTDVMLDCTVPYSSGVVQPVVHWESSRGQVLTAYTENKATLKIESVQMSHAGNYTCVVEVDGARTSKSLQLNVIPNSNGRIIWSENPRVVRRNVGEDASIDCAPTTLLTASTSWRKENAASLPNNAVQRGSRLEFRNLRLSDAGTYACTARNSLGTSDLYVTLVVDGPPSRPVVSANGERLDPDGVKTYEAGDRVTLTCLAAGSPSPQYTWSRTNPQGTFTQLTTGSNVQISDGVLSGKGSQLVIAGVSKDDEGYYNCTAYNSYGSKYVYSRLVVRPANAVPSNVNIVGSGIGVLRNMYKTGETAVLRCVASSSTSMTYRWTFSNGPLPSNALTQSAVLEMKNLNADNQGTYYCTVTNNAGSSSPAAHQVFISDESEGGNRRNPVSPVPSNSELTSPVGGIVQLRCPLPANADRIEWVRESNQALPASASLSNRNQVLDIYDVRAQDGGVYYCYALNSIGSSPRVPMSVIITQPGASPSVSYADGAPAYQRVRAGDTVNIACIASEPDSIIAWSRQDGKSLDVPNIKQLDGETLRISDIKTEDAGVYMCRATNRYGTSEPLLHTIEVARPTVVVPPTISAPDSTRIGATVDLTCSSSESDAQYIWTKVGEVLPSNSQQASGVLRIYDFTSEDAGVYSCSVKTSAGDSYANHRISAESSPLTLEIQAQGTQASGGYAEGTELKLLCIPSESGATVYWDRPGDNLPAASSQNGSTLILSKLSEIDRGTYRCRAVYGRSQVSGEYSFNVILSSGGEPVGRVVISVTPSNQLTQGSSVQLYCQAEGDGIYYEWSKSGGSIAPTATVRDGFLTIRSFDAADQGEYVCKASNNFGPSRTGSTRLLLRQTNVNPPSSPLLTISGIPEFGDSIILICSTMDDDADLTITRNGAILAKSTRPGADVEFGVGPINLNDFGTYSCVANRSALTRTSFVEVEVEGPAPPDYAVIQPPQAYVPAGIDLKFECLAVDIMKQKAAVNYVWSKDGGLMPRNAVVAGSILYFTNISDVDAGSYTCVASNKNGRTQATATLVVQDTTVNDATNPAENTMPRDTTTIADAVTTTVANYSLGAPSITSCRGIRTEGDACLVTLEVELEMADVDCRASGAEIIKYEWRMHGDDRVISSEPVLKVPVYSNFTSAVYYCNASNAYGSDSESWQLVKNAFLPGFVSDESYYKLPGIPDAYLSTTVDISFTPSEDTGLLLYSGAEKDEEKPRDSLALGLVDGTPVLKLDLGSGVDEFPSKEAVVLNQPNTIRIKRNKKYVKMEVNGAPQEYESKGEFIGLNLDQSLYVAGLPDDIDDQFAGFGKSYAGVVNSLHIQGKLIMFDRDTAADQNVIAANACMPIQCDNGGECVNTRNEQGYECICPKGYAGTMCSVVGMACYPGYCSNHGECSDTVTGPMCDCELGYRGDNCEIDTGITTPHFERTGYIQYSPLEDVMRKTTMEVMIKPSEVTDGLIAYSGENQFGSGDYIALLLRNNVIVFTFDLGGGAAVIESSTQIQPEELYKIQAERSDIQGSLIINGGIANKASVEETTTTTTTTAAAGGWLFSGGSSAEKPKAKEESPDGTNIGLNVKTPLFIGGVSNSYMLPADLHNISGFTGCISEVKVGSRDIDIIKDAEGYANISSCTDPSIMNDDPCLKLPCGSHGQCNVIDGGTFSCTCDPGYIGKVCDQKKTACSINKPCKNNGICEPVGKDDFKCRCIVGWTGETCETRESSGGFAYAQGSQDSTVVPKMDADDFAIASNFLNNKQDVESPSSVSGGRSGSGRRRFNDATRHRDFFKIWKERRQGARDNTIKSGKKACFGGGGYLEIPRQLLPSSSPEMRVQLTVATRSKGGVIYWQGQQMDISGVGRDFFGIGLSNGYVKFSFELGGGPAVLTSNITVNDGSSHVIVAQRKGQEGTLQVDDLPKVTAVSGGPHKQLNGNGNIYLGGVPYYKRMVSNVYKPGFNGCISHVKLSGTNGAVDLFKQKLSGVDVTDE